MLIWLVCDILNLEILMVHRWIYCKGNDCVDRLVNMGHLVQRFVWLDTLPLELHS